MGITMLSHQYPLSMTYVGDAETAQYHLGISQQGGALETPSGVLRRALLAFCYGLTLLQFLRDLVPHCLRLCAIFLRLRLSCLKGAAHSHM